MIVLWLKTRNFLSVLSPGFCYSTGELEVSWLINYLFKKPINRWEGLILWWSLEMNGRECRRNFVWPKWGTQKHHTKYNLIGVLRDIRNGEISIDARILHI